MKTCPYPCLFLSAIISLSALTAGVTPAYAGLKEYKIGPVPEWVKRITAAAAPAVPVEQVSQGVYYVLSDVQVRVEGKNKTTYNHFATKAVNEAGVEEAAHVEIRFDPSYQTLTLHSIKVRRGKAATSRLKASQLRVVQREKDMEYRIYDGSKTANVFLDDVRVGDIVEYDYTLSGTNPVFGGRQFGQFDLQWKVPVGRAYARLLWPSARKLYIASHNAAIKPGVRRVNGYQEYQWDVKTPQVLVVENDAPGWYDPYASVQWSEFKDWASVVQWAMPLYRVPLSPGGAVQKEIERIAQASADPQERLLAALHFVQREIRYLGVEVGAGSHAPRQPRLVLERRFGDCKDKSLLTVTMLRGLGIEAHPALVNTGFRRGILNLHPSPAAFNHVIVHARLDGRDLWIDPTRSIQLGDTDHLYQPDYGYALVLDSGTATLASMDNPGRIFRRRMHAVLDSRAGLSEPAGLTIATVFEGGSSDAVRNTFSSSNREELQKEYLNFYARYYPGITVKTPFSVAEDAAANRVTVTEQYTVPGFWQRNEAKKRKEAGISVPEMEDLLLRPRTPVRQAPLNIGHPVEFTAVTEVLLPEPWNTEQSGTVVDNPAFAFKRSISEKDNIVRFEDHYLSRADHVAPGDMASYVADLDRALDSLNYNLYYNDTPPVKHLLDRMNWSVALAGLLFLQLWIWLAFKLYRYDPMPPAQPERLQSIGGWLILPAIGVILSPIRTLADFIEIIPNFAADNWTHLTTAGGTAYHAMWAPVLLFELGANLAKIVFSVMLAVLFFKKRRSTPYVYIGFLGGSGLLNAADLILAGFIPAAASSISPKDWSALSIIAVSFVVWSSYFMVSQRVKATFVKGYGPAADL